MSTDADATWPPMKMASYCIAMAGVSAAADTVTVFPAPSRDALSCVPVRPKLPLLMSTFAGWPPLNHATTFTAKTPGSLGPLKPELLSVHSSWAITMRPSAAITDELDERHPVAAMTAASDLASGNAA
ncbi:MAG: hypothetical protein U0575_03655 [Phycisphaerales bacterium]